MNLNSYATLNAFRTRQALAAADTSDDDRMLSKLRSASSDVDRWTARTFAPMVATRKFDWRNPKRVLFAGGDLVELTSLLNGDGVTTIPSTDYFLLGGHQGNDGAYYGIELDLSRNRFYYNTTKRRAISVVGVWCWHDDYANIGWRLSNETVPGGNITSSATTFTASNNSGVDAWNLTPRFQVGQLIRMESEYCRVVAVATNTITIIRGVNGSTAAAHNSGVPIYIYQPPIDVVEVTLRWAAWLYKQEDSGDFAGQTADASLGSQAVASALPPDLLQKLYALQNRRVS